MKEDRIKMIDIAVINLKKKYRKYRFYQVMKPIIIIAFSVSNIIYFFISAKWVSHWVLTALTMIGFYSIVYVLIGKQLKKCELFAYLIDEPFDSISSIVHNIDYLLDEKEALKRNASEEELVHLRAKKMFMTGNTVLKKRNKN